MANKSVSELAASSISGGCAVVCGQSKMQGQITSIKPSTARIGEDLVTIKWADGLTSVTLLRQLSDVYIITKH